jgi:hypothetical protein
MIYGRNILLWLLLDSRIVVLRREYTDAILFPNPWQESHSAGRPPRSSEPKMYGKSRGRNHYFVARVIVSV